METAIKIKTDNLDEKAPLYFQYQIQNQPQPAYIELDCRGDGELMADYSGEIGNAVPMYYWHRLAVRWSVPSEISGTSLQSIFADEDFLACCQRIVNGFEEKWDGSNWVGHYDEDAKSAIEQAERIIEQLTETVEVWSAENWLFSNCSLREHWCDQPIEEAVAALEGCEEANQMIYGDLIGVLISEAKSLFCHKPQKLTRTHVDELLKRGEITEVELSEWVEEHGN